MCCGCAWKDVQFWLAYCYEYTDAMNDFHVKLAPAAILTGDRWKYAHASPFKLVKTCSYGTIATALFLKCVSYSNMKSCDSH